MSGIGNINKELLGEKVLSDLKVIAKQLNIKGITKLKKDELIARIMEEIGMDYVNVSAGIPPVTTEIVGNVQKCLHGLRID